MVVDMTTISNEVLRGEKIRVPIDNRLGDRAGLKVDSSIFEPLRLRERLELLDALDAGFGDLEPGAFGEDAMNRGGESAHGIRSRLEDINAKVYESIRSEIAHGVRGHSLLRWFQASACGEEQDVPANGLAYDWRDDLLSGILQLREPGESTDCRGREMVFYQPTPVRHILRLIAASALTEDDVLVDLGSGLGHVPLLVSTLAGVESLGIEVEAAYVATARECAERLHRDRVHFTHEDARTADLSGGTVFYVYSSFTGSIMADVLGRLRREGARRRIRICALGPCVATLAKESWLVASTAPDPDRITVFYSRE